MFTPAALEPEEEIAVEAAIEALERDAEWSRFVEQHRRFHARAGADPDDPEVTALAAEMEDDMRTLIDAMVVSTPAGAEREELAGCDTAFAAALEVLAPAQRRVMELTFAPLLSRRP